MDMIVDNELMIVENKIIRDQYVDKVEVLDKVKALQLLPDNTHVTVEMIANYYVVEINTIEKIITRNKQELISDGLSVLEGNQLTDIKSACQIKSRIGDQDNGKYS